jgi:hypothetical protein
MAVLVTVAAIMVLLHFIDGGLDVLVRFVAEKKRSSGSIALLPKF